MKKYIPFGLLLLILAGVVFVFSLGCTSTKQVEVTKYDSSAIRQVDSFSIEIKKLSVEYEKLKIESKKTSVVFKDIPCPDVKIDSTCNKDSLVKLIRQQQEYIRSLKNTVKLNADGSKEFKGQIASFGENLEKVEREANRLYNENLKLISKNDSLTTELSKSNVKKDKKTKVLNQWWLFPAGMLFMALIFYRKKIVSLLKK